MSPEQTIRYLEQNDLLLVTAESCTAGRIIALLAEVEGSGARLECGYVVYSPEAKQRLLGVNPKTVEQFNLTSVEVAHEMALGALRDSPANVAIATTGLCGTEDIDGIPAGTVCFAWGFVYMKRVTVFTQTHRFFGDRATMQSAAASYALRLIHHYHNRMAASESA